MTISDLVEFFFAVSPADQDLASHTESETYRVNGNVNNPGQSRCAQLHLSHPAEKGSIYYLNDILRQQTEQDRQTYFYDMSIGIHKKSTIRRFYPSFISACKATNFLRKKKVKRQFIYRISSACRLHK